MSKTFEVVIFTASHPSYANKVIDLLDPDGEFISLRLFRSHCYCTKEGIYIKDLRILRGRDPKNLIIVDNSVYCFGFNLNNGIPILPFFDDFEDTELKNLENFLMQVMKFNDVRSIIGKVFRYDVFKKSMDEENELIKELVMESTSIANEFITLL